MLTLILAAAAAYPTYNIGNLADKIPHERAYVVAGLLGGAAATIAGMGSWTAPTELQKKIGIIGASALSTSFVYSVGRGVFKQSPKKSLIAGLVITGTIGAFMWYNSKLNLKSNSNTTLDKPKMASNLK